MKRNILLSVVFSTALAPLAYAGGDIFLQCAQQYPGDDAERLKCYDRLATPASALTPAARKNIVPDENPEASTTPATPAAAPTRSTGRSYLTKAWNLDNLSNLDPSKLGRLQPYRQSYLLANRTSNPNRQPSSPAIGRSSLAPSDIDAAEVKFQFSVKADIGDQRNIDFLGIRTFRLWGGIHATIQLAGVQRPELIPVPRNHIRAGIDRHPGHRPCVRIETHQSRLGAPIEWPLLAGIARLVPDLSARRLGMERHDFHHGARLAAHPGEFLERR
jgi:hypothetical protein